MEKTPAESAKDSGARPMATESGKDGVKHRIAGPLFFQAALEGKADDIRNALESGTDANTVDETGRTALMLAAFNGHTAVIQLLLGAKADVHKQDGMGRTALMYAATGPNADTVRMLLESGAKVNETDRPEKWTALMFAAAEGHREVVRLLLEKGANAALVDVDGDNAAAFAAQRGHADLAKMLSSAEKAPASAEKKSDQR